MPAKTETPYTIVDSVSRELAKLLLETRQQNEELKNMFLAMRCEVTKIADDLWDMDGPLAIINRLRKLAE